MLLLNVNDRLFVMPTLYLTSSVNSVRLANDAFIVHTRATPGVPESHSRILMRDVSRVVVSGSPNVSMPVIKQVCRYGIPLVLLSSRFGWIGEFCGSQGSRDTMRRLAQYRIAVDESLMCIAARELISAKIFNQRFILRRLASRNFSSSCARTLAILKNIQKGLAGTTSLAEIRGKEGCAASIYFSSLSEFFPEETPFPCRSRRPPADAANALLSFAYAVIRAEIESAVHVHGLDPCLGCLHSVNYGKPSLSLDLMEPLRPPVDAFVLSLLNRKILSLSDFSRDEENGGVYLTDGAIPKFFKHYEQNICRKFFFDLTGTSVSLRDIVDWQVCRYAEFLSSVAKKDVPAVPHFFKMPQ